MIPDAGSGGLDFSPTTFKGDHDPLPARRFGAVAATLLFLLRSGDGSSEQNQFLQFLAKPLPSEAPIGFPRTLFLASDLGPRGAMIQRHHGGCFVDFLPSAPRSQHESLPDVACPDAQLGQSDFDLGW